MQFVITGFISGVFNISGGQDSLPDLVVVMFVLSVCLSICFTCDFLLRLMTPEGVVAK